MHADNDEISRPRRRLPQNFDKGLARHDADRARRLGVARSLEASGDDPFRLCPLCVNEICGSVAFDDAQDPQLGLMLPGQANRAGERAISA
jgi:hypothetical protein